MKLDSVIAFSEYASDIQKNRGDLCKLVIIFGGGGEAVIMRKVRSAYVEELK
jgi:hypothetical protein